MAGTFLAVSVTDGTSCHCHSNVLTNSSYFPGMLQACLKPCTNFGPYLAVFFPLFIFQAGGEEDGVWKCNQIHMLVMHLP